MADWKLDESHRRGRRNPQARRGRHRPFRRETAVKLYRFLCCGGSRPCFTARCRFLLEAAHLFARSRGYGPDDVAWLGCTLVLGGLRFEVEVI